MDAIDQLTRIFEKFPGIGPRQAHRFVQFLLRSSSVTRRELVEGVEALAESVRQCSSCMRHFSGSTKTCDICSDEKRDASLLSVVASDADLAALEHGGSYEGHYFVLGGTISLASEKTNGLRFSQLLSIVSRRMASGLQEIILAFPANPEGDATGERMREELVKFEGLKITSLGRGLSTGSELEYADPETLKNALRSRR